MTPAEFHALVVEVVNPVWPGELSAPERADVWCRHHTDIDPAVAWAAWEWLIATARGHWLPMPGQVRRAAVHVAEVLPPEDPGDLYSLALDVVRSRPGANAHEAMRARWELQKAVLLTLPFGDFALEVAARCDLVAVAQDRNSTDARDRFVKAWRSLRDWRMERLLLPGGLRGVRLPRTAAQV